MRKFFIFLGWMSSFGLGVPSLAQIRFQPFTSVEASAGVSRLVSDLSPLNSLQQGYRWSGGVGGFRHIKPGLALGATFDWTRLGADDYYSANDQVFFRNLQVRNDVKSVNVLGKLYIKPFETAIGRSYGTWHPYLTAGIGYYFHNPKARTPVPERNWTDLQPLRTEGQGIVSGVEDPYKLRGLQIPLGFGIERLEGRWIFGVSAQVVFVGTDYLDDVKGNYYNLSGIYTPALTDLQISMAQRHVEITAARSQNDRTERIVQYFEGLSLPTTDIANDVRLLSFGTNPTVPLLTLRGQVAGNDFYGMIRFKVAYTLRDGVRCP